MSDVSGEVSIRTRRIPEHPGPGRLGRHVEHDERSRAYAFNTTGLDITPVRHARNVPVFDQGSLGSCTGNSAVGCLASDPLYANLPPEHAALDEDLAVAIYSEATQLDRDPDNYPPNDTGSTGLAAAKALRNRHLILGYYHTFSAPDMVKALTLTPVMLGINWYDSFDEPDSHGRLSLTRGSNVRGGHEVYADEIVIDGDDLWIGFTNSWGSSWAQQGRGYFSFHTLERLLAEDGDAVMPVPRPAPPLPQPPPPPAPTVTDDHSLWSAMQSWAKGKGLT